MEMFYDKQVLSWSKLLLSVSGLWPENPNDFRFFFYITYVTICTLLLITSLAQNMHDIEKMMRNITFTFPSVLIVLKNVMFRWKRNKLLPLLAAVRRDASEGLYRHSDEKCRVIWYNIASTLFTSSSVMSLFFVPTLFYIKPIFDCLLSSESGECFKKKTFFFNFNI